MYIHLFITLSLLVLTCREQIPQEKKEEPFTNITIAHSIGNIPAPEGYERINVEGGSFANWLRQINLKKDSRVFLYNGKLKRNQSAQFAVLDIPIGEKDLQQCADAIMRLKAEYLYAQNKCNEISFSDNAGKHYTCRANVKRGEFESYLQLVFSYCGTYSLQKQLKAVRNFKAIQSGDVLISGGFPGHAVIVADVAVNKNGKKAYLLAQSYMPAQDIHLLKNPMHPDVSPWYFAEESSVIETPEWTFHARDLHTW